jgi:biopolymer transport protein ExbB
MDALALLAKGGLFLIPIGLCSILGLALFIDRLLYLRPDRIVPSDFVKKARAFVDDGDRDGLVKLCASSDVPVARVIGRGLVHEDGNRGHMRESMEDGGRLELRGMKRYTGAIAAIATIAPLLGLLGTVVGMITTFQAVVASSSQGASAVDVGQLAGGIWQALITTAAGLIVAIPVVIAHRYIGGRIERLLNDIEDLGGHVIDHLGRSITPEPEAEAAE